MSHHDSEPLVGALDQGTSSTRFLIFSSKTAEVIADHQIEVEQSFPHEGWVEEDPMEILDTAIICMEKTAETLKSKNIPLSNLAAIGISNQRETTILWDKLTGQPLHNAIIWMDTRTTEIVEEFTNKAPGKKKQGLQLTPLVFNKCGLPISTYFSAVKIAWLIRVSKKVREAIDEDRCCFGTVDTWLLWNLTGGPRGGAHYTDVSNASRTMLMNINTMKWDPELCKFFGVPMTILPEIRSSSEIYGYVAMGPYNQVPVSGILGDQSAALVGQLCLKAGMAKNTYGTGCFLLYNTGTKPIFSTHGLLTTVAYQLGKDAPVKYALEGSVAIAGAGIQWLRKNLKLFNSDDEVESIASSVTSAHGVFFVPAFSGLFAPHWETEAKGMIVGLTQFATKAHIVRATLDAICYQTREILEAMKKDSNITLQSLRVDGGMCKNNLLMQLQANIINMPVVRPAMLETTALGAAIAAGTAEGVQIWNLDSPDLIPVTTDTTMPAITKEQSETKFTNWKRAVDACIFWAKLQHSAPETEAGIENGFEKSNGLVKSEKSNGHVESEKSNGHVESEK